jgi:hypothetical protein
MRIRRVSSDGLNNDYIVERKWLWAFPQIEGVPPAPRGGHSATLTGASLVIFGVRRDFVNVVFLGAFLRRVGYWFLILK